MAKRRNKYAFAGQRPAQIDCIDQSRFWRRLDDLSATERSENRKRAIDHLKASIRKVTAQARWISAQVCRFMPQYTLHEERHFLNVLAIMDAMVPDEVIARFGALDCGLTILAAYTHDLGMALSEREYDRLHDESTEEAERFASYRAPFDKELQLGRWRKRLEELSGSTDAKSRQEAAAARKRIESIEGHILASYLRETHTEDEQVQRLRRWLDVIKQQNGDENLFRYGVGGKDYQRELTLIGISHGRGAPWLRRQLIEDGPDDRFYQAVATGESTNLAFPGLLLRLADVMDFDASRAPRILFKHFGIENEQSVLEWKKHLSIIGWRLDVDPDGQQEPDLLYSAECQHPVHEKCIREFKTWIDAELSAVRVELDAQRRQLRAAQLRYDLHLPSHTRVDIRAARDPLTDQPEYVYHDLQFRLDQDEIQQLLMGESLYGDPGLCIRELLQNALDALELRELRLKMKQKGVACKPVDGELVRPGWVRNPDGREEELRVTLDWGTDEATGYQWLRVTDNGVGMTEEVIKNYFTQIGKSYYRSAEFDHERAAMTVAGEVVSPISIFGIGILSCFMIADRLRVRTSAGGAHTRLDITISGPSSLFWIEQGTLPTQGTEIQLFVKSDFTIQHDSDTFLVALRKYFGYQGFLSHHEPSITIDPPLLAAMSVVWPKFPIDIRSSPRAFMRLDARFHQDKLRALEHSSIISSASKRQCPTAIVGEPRWRKWDYIDSVGDNATGSRIRLWFAENYTNPNRNTLPLDGPPDDHVCRQDELSVLVEDSLSQQNRTMVLVRGMHIPRDCVTGSVLRLRNRIGTIVWIDLRGPVAPGLTITRLQTVAPKQADAWACQVNSLLKRFGRALEVAVAQHGDGALRNVLCGFAVPFLPIDAPKAPEKEKTFSLMEACRGKWYAARNPYSLTVTLQRYLEALGCDDEKMAPDNCVDNESDRCVRDAELSHWLGDSYYHNLDADLTHVRARGLTRMLARPASRPCIPLFDELDDTWTMVHEAHCGVSELRREHRRRLRATIDYWDQRNRLLSYRDQFSGSFSAACPVIDLCMEASILQEALRPDLQSSWPVFGLNSYIGVIGDAVLLGPDIVSLNVKGDGRAIRVGDPDGEIPMQLAQRGYDLTFPMTAVPLGQLRRECAEWRSSRWHRSLGVAPFLLPALHDIWLAHAEFLLETFKLRHIYCLLPRFELWSKCFSDWTDVDWHDTQNLSAVWDLSGHLTGTPGQVLWSRGTHDIHEMASIGLPAPQFLGRE